MRTKEGRHGALTGIHSILVTLSREEKVAAVHQTRHVSEDERRARIGLGLLESSNSLLRESQQTP